MIHLPTEEYVEVRLPPEEKQKGKVFKNDTYFITWEGNHFDKTKITTNEDESDIIHEKETIDNGNKDVDKPVTDMRDIDSYKWELKLDKIKREVKYVETNEQAVKWLSGEYNTGFQSHDLRSRIKDKFSQSEYEKLVNKFNIE